MFSKISLNIIQEYDSKIYFKDIIKKIYSNIIYFLFFKHIFLIYIYNFEDMI